MNKAKCRIFKVFTLTLMHEKKSSLILFLLFITICSSGKTWLVGPTRTYTMPSQVSTLVGDGDTVAIDSGTYSQDVAFWAANDLVLEGIGGMARLKSGGLNYGGKAIWVVNGNNTIVNYIEFSECTCSDNNGAGIRQQGINLTVYHCLFDSNQEGILADDDTTSDILIEYTEFNANGAGDGYSHNLYINHVHSLTFQYNYTHNANVGHELKSRAYNNYLLYNRFADDSTGTASRDIDLPNGGFSIILGNEIEKGPDAQNENVMEFGLEGLTNPSTQLYIVNNSIVSDRSTTLFVDLQPGTSLFTSYNNIFAGPGTILVDSASTVLDTSHNWYVLVDSVGFVDAAAYNYHLLPTSGAINNGINPGYAWNFSLTPIYEYVQPTSDTPRIVNGQLDIGAHEYGTATGTYSPVDNKMAVYVYPNPSNGMFNIQLPVTPAITTLELFNYTGQLVLQKEINAEINKTSLSVNGLPEGVYLLKIMSDDNFFTRLLDIQR
jgi:hypothetical protein